MRKVGLLLLILGLNSGIAYAQDASAATADKSQKILQNSRAALIKLMTAMYSADYYETGVDKGSINQIEGRGITGRRDASGLHRFRMELTFSLEGSIEQIPYTIGSDGTDFFALDRRIGVIYEDTKKEVLGTHGNDMMKFLMAIYSDPDPFAKELEAESFYVGDEQVGEESCYKVRVKGANKSYVIWSIAKSDSYPRKRVEVGTNSDGSERRSELTVTFFVPNPRWSAQNMFEAPDEPGYVKLPVFAP